MALKYIDEIDFTGKRVLARFDFNTPLNKSDPSKITDTSRVDMALKTIKYILENGASKLTLMSHLGRPKGERNPNMSLAPVATYLAEQLGKEVILTESSVDCGVKELLTLNETKIVLLENLRFHPEETKNDEEFARKLATYGDIFVMDAFGAAHREHASTHRIHKFFHGSAYGGFLIKEELKALQAVTDRPAKPFVGIIGGAKVKDKIKTLEKLLINVDHLIIGGAMAYPFLKAQEHNVGKSLCSDEDIELAKKILKADKGNKISLPIDHICSDDINGKALPSATVEIEENLMGLDIGEKSIALFTEKMQNAKTIFWNGPMGFFENPDFAQGSMKIAEILANSGAFTFVGGGDSVSAVKKSGFSSKISHISTGGGASIEFIEKGDLPGVNALKFGI